MPKQKLSGNCTCRAACQGEQVEYNLRDSGVLVDCLIFVIAVKYKGNQGQGNQVNPQGVDPGEIPKGYTYPCGQDQGEQEVKFVGIRVMVFSHLETQSGQNRCF